MFMQRSRLGQSTHPSRARLPFRGRHLKEAFVATSTNHRDGGVRDLGMVGPRVLVSRPDRRVVVMLWVLVFSAKPVQHRFSTVIRKGLADIVLNFPGTLRARSAKHPGPGRLRRRIFLRQAGGPRDWNPVRRERCKGHTWCLFLPVPAQLLPVRSFVFLC